jgi:hypothetical protein
LRRAIRAFEYPHGNLPPQMHDIGVAPHGRDIAIERRAMRSTSRRHGPRPMPCGYSLIEK